MMRRSLLLATLAALPVPALSAQTPARFAARVDAYAKSELTRQQIPGFSLAVMRRGRIVLERGYGMANVEHQVPATPATIYQSGSLGKQFTAAAIMLLVQEGKLSLADSVTGIFPDAPARWGAVTIRHLLTHTSGAGDYPEDFDYRRDQTEDEMTALVLSRPFDFSPGAKWQYSNLGYMLLGAIIHRVSGQFYGDLLHDRIFLPFGLRTARIISEADIVPNRAAGYRMVEGQLKNQEWVSPVVNTTADGSLYLTVRDIARWDSLLYSDDLLTPESLREITTPVVLNSGMTYPYGFGWRVGSANGRRIMAHSGSWQGFKSYFVRYPDDSVSVVIFANVAEADVTTIAQGVAALWDGGLVALDDE
ncbi:MAG: serine hydrolase domain-containing protein [Gemmatimonadota bacterium]|nr:serine hydrolase domain-containing protein [Gemmatimonadota bacterium]